MPAYSELVIDHFENPRNLGELENADILVRVGDPVCGDTIDLSVTCDPAGWIAAAKFRAYGCAPALALGSILTEHLIGRSWAGLETLDEDGICVLLGGLAPNQRHVSSLGLRVITSLGASWVGGAVT